MAVREPLGRAPSDTHHAERHDEWHHAKGTDDRAIEQTNGPAHGDREKSSERGSPAFVEGERANDTGQGHDRADAQIDAAADDNDRHAESAGRHDDRLSKNDFGVGASQERRTHHWAERKKTDDQQQPKKRAQDIEQAPGPADLIGRGHALFEIFVYRRIKQLFALGLIHVFRRDQ